MSSIFDSAEARLAKRRRLTEQAQRDLNEWYRLNGRQPWEYEHPGGVTPTTVTGDSELKHYGRKL